MSDPLVKRHAYGTRPRSVSRSSIVDIEKEEEPVPRRTLTNRLSAIRSKERQRAYVTGLEQRVKELNSQLTAYHASLHAHALESLDLGATNENLLHQLSELRQRTEIHSAELLTSAAERARLRHQARELTGSQSVKHQVTGSAAVNAECAAQDEAPIETGSKGGGGSAAHSPSKQPPQDAVSKAAAAPPAQNEPSRVISGIADSTESERDSRVMRAPFLAAAVIDDGRATPPKAEESCLWESFLQWDADPQHDTAHQPPDLQLQSVDVQGSLQSLVPLPAPVGAAALQDLGSSCSESVHLSTSRHGSCGAASSSPGSGGSSSSLCIGAPGSGLTNHRSTHNGGGVGGSVVTGGGAASAHSHQGLLVTNAGTSIAAHEHGHGRSRLGTSCHETPPVLSKAEMDALIAKYAVLPAQLQSRAASRVYKLDRIQIAPASNNVQILIAGSGQQSDNLKLPIPASCLQPNEETLAAQPINATGKHHSETQVINSELCTTMHGHVEPDSGILFPDLWDESQCMDLGM